MDTDVYEAGLVKPVLKLLKKLRSPVEISTELGVAVDDVLACINEIASDHAVVHQIRDAIHKHSINFRCNCTYRIAKNPVLGKDGLLYEVEELEALEALNPDRWGKCSEKPVYKETIADFSRRALEMTLLALRHEIKVDAKLFAECLYVLDPAGDEEVYFKVISAAPVSTMRRVYKHLLYYDIAYLRRLLGYLSKNPTVRLQADALRIMIQRFGV
jgi:hypothetical protein